MNDRAYASGRGPRTPLFADCRLHRRTVRVAARAGSICNWISLAGSSSNANGGVAVGYGYAANGNLDPASCGGFLWLTGEDLRNTTNGGLLPDLAANGALNLNGLEGNGIAAVAPANVPPLLSYFVDYDAQFDDPAIRGYLGDIAISRPCFQHAVLPGPAEAPGSAGTPPIVGGAATLLGGPLYPPPPLLPPNIPPKPPSGSCPGGVFNSVTGGCCPSGSLVNPVTGACQPNCPPGQPRNPITNQCCPSGTTPQLNGTCVPPLALPLTGCQVLGETTFCSNLDLGINVQCPAGQAMPNGLCCPSSTKPTALGCMATNAGCGGGGIASLCCPAGRAANFANNSCCQIGHIFLCQKRPMCNAAHTAATTANAYLFGRQHDLLRGAGKSQLPVRRERA